MHQAGVAPTQLRQLLVQLIPKVKSEGTRLIGFFQSFIRLFGRLLAEDTKAWDREQVNEGIWSMAAGRSPTDAVWRQSFIGEKAGNTLSHCLCLLWDLKAAYEHIEHQTLWEEAAFTKSPAAGLMAAVSFYRWSRV